jgi:two-component system OmpR family sensor kinase
MNAKSRSRGQTFGSMRSQLTFWYTGVLAFVLIIFAIITYTYLARAERQRLDKSLADTANSLVANFNNEVIDEHQPLDEAFRVVTHTFAHRDRQVIVYDEKQQVVLASNVPDDDLALVKDWFSSPAVQPSLRNLLASADGNGRAYATLFESENAVRLLAVTVSAGPQRFLFVVAAPLREQQRALAQARQAFFLAIPLALLLASLGGYLLARKSLAPVIAMGEEAAQIGASNLTERIRVPKSQELGRLANIFNDLLARLDQSFGQQKRFMADASHELRTPVAVIRGESEVALSGPIRPVDEYRESLAIVHDEGQRLTRMVDDLFILARADAGEYPLLLTDFYLDESLHECVRSVRSLAAEKNLDVVYQSPAKEIAFRGDEPLVRRMVLNLLYNAIKFTPKSGRVEVSVKGNSHSCEIVISDTGPGIPVAAQSQVFDRFFRVDKARSRDESLDGSGAGLGLSIAKWAAELHGGKIILERSNDTGTTFVISLPALQNRAR